jgi:hypothetical protein
MTSRSTALFAGPAAVLALSIWATAAPTEATRQAPPAQPTPMFQTADQCIVCHNAQVTSSGEDVSIGADWRASMMANSARDPYWQAAVRREVMDHPAAQAAIEDECSKCHMPMARLEAHARGATGEIFAHLPIGKSGAREAVLAADGVSCTTCHQISARGLGSRESFTGGFVIDTTPAAGGERPMFGPYDVARGHATIMRSATGYQPTEASHLQQSELCATCHTLYTHALDRDGQAIAELPEQVPYEEWLHSAYRTEQSCQSCHMPVVTEEMPIATVLGPPRSGFSRHEFRGGNFFMIGMLNRYRDELGVTSLPQELSSTALRTVAHLQTRAASLAIERVTRTATELTADVRVTNLAGHKLPTAYPSRRVWVHVTVHDASGRVLFESGRFEPRGSIAGNDNDEDPGRFEPHYSEITREEDVQIYESIMVDQHDAVTTGLLSGVRYVKDNRVLPRGFDKATADAPVAVHGEAVHDADFAGGGDRIRYRVAIGQATGPVTVTAQLWYQPISFRWAENLRRYDAAEPQRFVRYYEAMAAASAVVLARADTLAEH